MDDAQLLIIERAQHPLFAGTLTNATHVATGANLSCGDEITWEAEIREETVVALRHHCRACTVCTASADLLASELQGRSLQDLPGWTTEKVQQLMGIPLSPIRLKCALLPLETLRLLAPKTD
jgi:nitrogen fixation NifU-like protein